MPGRQQLLDETEQITGRQPVLVGIIRNIDLNKDIQLRPPGLALPFKSVRQPEAVQGVQPGETAGYVFRLVGL